MAVVQEGPRRSQVTIAGAAGDLALLSELFNSALIQCKVGLKEALRERVFYSQSDRLRFRRGYTLGFFRGVTARVYAAMREEALGTSKELVVVGRASRAERRINEEFPQLRVSKSRRKLDRGDVTRGEVDGYQSGVGAPGRQRVDGGRVAIGRQVPRGGGVRFSLASHVGPSFCLRSPFWDATLSPVRNFCGYVEKEGVLHVAGQLNCHHRSACPCAGFTSRHRFRVHLCAFLQAARVESRQATGVRSKLDAQPPLTPSPTQKDRSSQCPPTPDSRKLVTSSRPLNRRTTSPPLRRRTRTSRMRGLGSTTSSNMMLSEP